MRATTLLAFAAVVALAQASSQWSILAAPKQVKFDTHVAAPALSDIAAITADILGLPTNEGASWEGIKSANLFRRPHAAVTIAFEGLAQALSFDSTVAQYTLSAAESCKCMKSCVNTALTQSGNSVASQVAASLPASFSLSMSSCGKVATATASSAAQAHTISFNKESKNFEDSNAEAIVITDAHIRTMFSSGLLGNGITFDATANAFVVAVADKKYTLSLAQPEVEALFVELFGMLHTARTLATGSHRSPVVANYIVSRARSAVEAITCPKTKQAVLVVLARFAQAIKAEVSAAFNGQALVQVVSMNLLSATTTPAVSRVRSSAEFKMGAQAAIGVSDPIFDSTFDFAEVPFCSAYKYFCNVDSRGNPWDSATGCSTNCSSASTCNDCIWFGCAANDAGVMPGTRTCQACQQNFVLLDGYCYVDSIFPATFNIVLWLGIGVTLALIATCYTIGTIDPGRNTAIYRTGSHAKSK